MRRSLSDASLLFGSDIAARALNFVTLVFLARTLQPDRYGMLVVGASALEYAFLLSDWGLKTLGTRESALAQESRRFQPSTILAARAGLGLAIFVIGEFATAQLGFEPIQAMIIRVYLLSVIPFALMVDWYVQGRRSFGVLTIARILQSATLLGGVLLGVSGPDDVIAVPWIQVGATALATSYLFLARPGGDRLLPTTGDTRLIAKALATSTAIGVAGIFGQTFVVLPPLVVAEISGPSSAGVLHAALRLVILLLIVDRVFGALYLPALASQWSRDGVGTTPRFRTALRLLIPIGVGASLLASIHAGPAIAIVYQEQYIGGAAALSIAAWFVLATLLNTFFAFGLIAIGQERLYLRAGIVSGTLFVALLIVAASQWGAPGAAASIVAGEMVMTVLLFRYFRRTIDVRPVGPLVRSLAVAIPLTVLAHVVGGTALWLAPVYAVVFAGAMVALRVVGPDELAVLRLR